MNKIIYNLNTYQLVTIDFEQILVVGQNEAINIDLYFQAGSVFETDPSWQVWLTFERPDGESTNITLATLNNDHYNKLIGGWFTQVAGLGKIFTTIKKDGVIIAPFAVAKVQIFEGGTPSDETITQEQYNELLANINGVNNKLENHINDKNNPHEVTAEQLNVYEKEHVNEINERVIENTTDIADLKTDMGGAQGAINGLRTDVNKNTTDISNLGGRVSTTETNITNLGGRVTKNEQDIALRAKLTEVVALINAHNNDTEAHQYILRLIAAVSAGGVKPLVFDTEAELVEWLESGTIVHQGYTPNMLELGQLLYTIPEDELDYWVSVLPVNELNDLTPLQGMVDLSAYALLTDLEAYAKTTDLDGIYSSLQALNMVKVDKVDGKGLSTNDFTDSDKLEVGKIANKVDKVSGKGLSTNDYTTTEKNKLAGIATGAEVNEVNSVNAKQGVVVLNQDDIGDGSTYKRVSQVEKNTWNNKQDKLIAGVNISIVGNTISASGGEEATQDITAAEVKALYEANADTNAFTDTEKTKLSGIETGAEVNVQSDWNASSGDAFILNKPSIPTKVSDLTNDTGYITGYTETDPIFTAWNKSTGISITKSQVSDLLEATQSISGLMSSTDKQRLDVLHSLLEEDTANNVVDSINEVLAIFNNYPEGADLVTALAGKVDKVTGKSLSTNDLTNALKTKLDGLDTQTELDNKFDDKANKTDLAQVYGGKNLAGPILEGKEHLGDGNYRLYDDIGITVDYNVYNGVYTANGITTSNAIFLSNLSLPLMSNVTGSYYYIGGSLHKDDINPAFMFRLYENSVPLDDLINRIVLNYEINEIKTSDILFNQFRVYFTPNVTLNNFQFKLQLEEGSTATPYTLPAPFVLPHELTSGTWITPTLLNGWVNIASNELQYRKDTNGNIRLRGHLNGGTLDTVIATLPAGFRPLKTTYFICITDLTIGSGTIGTNGNITLLQGDLANVRLDTISFSTL